MPMDSHYEHHASVQDIQDQLLLHIPYPHHQEYPEKSGESNNRNFNIRNGEWTTRYAICIFWQLYNQFNIIDFEGIFWQ